MITPSGRFHPNTKLWYAARLQIVTLKAQCKPMPMRGLPLLHLCIRPHADALTASRGFCSLSMTDFHPESWCVAHVTVFCWGHTRGCPWLGICKCNYMDASRSAFGASLGDVIATLHRNPMWSVGTILNGLLSFMTDTAQVPRVIASAHVSNTILWRSHGGRLWAI